jgi:2-succinyl-6-hydroxy-2,4-cyclohexadiene-1-carboxylate synthase
VFVRLRDGLRLHLRDRGTGDPLLLLHGFTGCGEAWGEALLARLSKTWRALAVDLPGHGLSDAPERPARYALDAVLQDLTDLLDILGITRTAWVGYSMGGRIALGAAVHHPDRVGRLILESTSPGLASEIERAARRDSDEALATRIESRGIEAFVDHWEGLPLFATQRGLPEQAREAVRARRLRNRPSALAACVRGLGTGSQPSFWNELASIEARTLILAGAEDSRYRRIADRMSGEIPDTSLAVIAGAGHTPHLEAPGEWLDRIPALDAPLFSGRPARRSARVTRVESRCQCRDRSSTDV